MRILLAAAAAVSATLFSTPPLLAQTAAPSGDAGLVARGAYLAKAADCAACHRAELADGKPYVGGYAIASPMGNIIAPNITPSKTAGIGQWSFADFDRAMRKGERPDGGKLYPAMPYTDYQGISDADMHALYAYFMQGVQPVDTVTPKTHLPFPFNLRVIMAPWNWLFRSNKPFTAASGLDPQAQRGQYLVETLGHCGSCHTPRNLLMAEESAKALSGADVAGWHAPNITSDPISGVGGWSQPEIVDYLRNGHVTGKGVAAGGMGEAVENSLRYLTQPDLAAIAAYLKASKPVRDPAETKPAFAWTQVRPVPLSAYETGDSHDQAALAKSDTTDGALLYANGCASCHGLDGKGTKDGFYPPLLGSSTTGAANPANLVMTILNGVDREGADSHSFMPRFATQMNDDQVAAVANHVLATFGRPDRKVTAAMVADARHGGGKPLLLTLMPWLFGLGALVLVAIAYLGLRRPRRRQVA
ncbi:cytochrome c [Sphingomonas abietis]|uniref:Cytochrome c n=1 Tax=Sphingomonas abietis TaxID=3012344 RepID=A0ABY7NR21_9SPHN|nr:cytochrome c [Sphingomonas abietis]WBO23994.1 cytochrome c [Sphingomonas abietis]